MSTEFRKFDEPVTVPDNDLLGAGLYAEKLAHFIEQASPPFTLGIYGEWGAGKTSFVRLIQYYLTQKISKKKLTNLLVKQQPSLPDAALSELLSLKLSGNEKHNTAKELLTEKLQKLNFQGGQIDEILDFSPQEHIQFIYFSAWPYTTSDTIWRALVLEITRTLYKARLPQETVKKQSAKESTWGRLKKFLASDLVVFSRPPEQKDDLADYKSILASLDDTAYGSISKDTGLQYQFNHEVALTTIVEGALETLGTISPLVKLVRSLFGLEFKPDLSNVFKKEKNVATRKLIESIDGFRWLLRKIFNEQTKDTQIFVFVDDLDRCLPDVALDILEAIKIFLNDIPCIFIVAADDNLIGQGLRLRYKELFGNIDQARIESLLAVKGQEYFEKIIQFGIRVPPKTSEQTHSFITAQFPRWMPATDIIQAAIGSNPRRLKQYCNRLTYNFMVYQLKLNEPTNDKATSKPDDTEALNKMVQLSAWSLPCASEICRLAELLDTLTFKKSMLELEKWIKITDPDNPIPEAIQSLESCSCVALYKIITDVSPLLGIFNEEPLFSTFDPVQVATFAKFAHTSPLQNGMIQTSDPTFKRIYEISKVGFSARNMMIDNLARLVDFHQNNPPEINDYFFQIAENDKWPQTVIELEELVDNPKFLLTDNKDIPGVPEGLQTILTQLQATKESPTTSQNDHISFLELKDQLVKLPRLSTLLRQEVIYFKQAIAEGLPEITLESTFKNTGETKNYKIAYELYKNWDKKECSENEFVTKSLELRFTAINYFKNLRTIAKLDNLDYKWPELGQKTRLYGRVFLKALESGFDQESLPVFNGLKTYLQDEALTRFLALEPLFRDMPDIAINKYLAVSQLSANASPNEEKTTGLTATPNSTPALISDKSQFKSLLVSVETLASTEPLQLGTPIPAQLPTHTVKLSFDTKEATANTILNAEQILARMERVRFQKPVLSSINTRGLDFSEELTENPEDFGSWLWNTLLGGNQTDNRALNEILNNALSSEKLRIILQLKDESLFSVPWETMYLPEQSTFISITQKFSLIRYTQLTQAGKQNDFDAPIKILVVIASPKDAPYLEYNQERDIISNTLKEAVDRNQVEIYILEHASIEKLQRTLRIFQPHIFHFIGHGAQGKLVLENEENGAVEFLETDQLSVLLDTYKINIAFLNACHTATPVDRAVSTGTAGTLVKKGVPAVVANTEPIPDKTAILFTKEFYQALVDGYSLESAVTEARKALWLEQLEWHSYILYTSTYALENYRLKIPGKRETESR